MVSYILGFALLTVNRTGCKASSDVMCNETDIQLVDGVTDDDGRVQICFSGLWASVCDDFWDVRDATVVCRQLGYNGCKFSLHNFHHIRVVPFPNTQHLFQCEDILFSQTLLNHCFITWIMFIVLDGRVG